MRGPIVILFFFAGCSGQRQHTELPLLTLFQKAELLKRLRAKELDSELLMSRGDVIDCPRSNPPVRIVWLSTDSPIGEGLIGVYDVHTGFSHIRQFGSIDTVTLHSLNGIGQVAAVVERASGTGMVARYLHILDANDLHSFLDSREVALILEGVELRNRGRYGQNTVLVYDMDRDGTDELLDLRIERTGSDLAAYEEPSVECLVYSFDTKHRKFEAQEFKAPPILYPPTPVTITHERGLVSRATAR